MVRGIAVLMAAGVPASAALGDNKGAHLLFVRADKEVEGYDDIAKCEPLTIDKYKELGTQVTEVSPDDLKAWLKEAGKPYAKGSRQMQLYHMAKAKGAQAYGGLATMTVPEERAIDRGVKAGVYVYGWGVSLDGLTARYFPDLSGGMEARAVPLRLGGEDNLWGLTRKMEARLPAPTLEEGGFNPYKGRPFLGVRTEGNKLIKVTPESPAELAGMQTGDTLLKVNGKAIADTSDIGAAFDGSKPGDEVEVVYEREGKEHVKKVALADFHELVNVKLSPMGKPLKPLKATDVSGKEVSLDQFAGKVLLVDFWATWCEPCKDEAPIVQSVWEKYKDRGLEWLGVSADTEDAARLWKATVERNGYGGVHIRDPKWDESMNGRGYPMILLVDRSGIVRADVRGGQIAEAVEYLLSEGAVPSGEPVAADAK